MPRSKIKERRGSLFGIGLWPSLLFFVASLLAPITRSDSWADWFAVSLKSFGLTRIDHLEAEIIGSCIALAFGISGSILANREKISRQVARDAEIQRPGSKALFIRPFFADKKFFLPNPFYSYWSAGISPEGTYMRPEEFVGRVLEPYVSVMEIGGDPKSISSGKIYPTDDDWRESFMKVVQDATFIVVLPMLGLDKAGRVLGEATLWELCHLVESQRISRTIVIMPKVPPLRRKSARRCWEQARLAATGFGLLLPEYRTNGSIMLFGQRSDVWEVEQDFVGSENGKNSLAAGLVKAVGRLSVKNGFTLLDR